MNRFSPQFRESEHGVHLPHTTRRDMALYGAGAALMVGLHFLENGPPLGAAWIFLALAAYHYFRARRAGPHGFPIAALEGDTIVLRSADALGRPLRINVSSIEQVKVYGPQGMRMFRLLRPGLPAIEVAPAFTHEQQEAVTRFLQKALPGKVLVVNPASAQPQSCAGPGQ